MLRISGPDILCGTSVSTWTNGFKDVVWRSSALYCSTVHRLVVAPRRTLRCSRFSG